MNRIGVLFIIILISAKGVEIPNIGDVLQEVTPSRIEKKQEILPPLEQSKEYEKVFKEGKKVFIKSFLISGAEHISNKELKKIVQAYENSMLSFNQIQELAKSITKAYKNKGYFVAKAYLPIQDLKAQDNILKIVVIEGEYGNFYLKNNSLVKDFILQNNLEKIADRKTVSLQSLQRGLLIINNTPGVKIGRSQVKPGKEIGTSDFIIEAQSEAKYNGYIVTDNYGSKYTGRYRMTTGLDINSPFKIGDQLSFSLISSQNSGLFNGRVAYKFPLNSDGLRGELSYSKTTYELGSSYSELDALGYADSFSSKLSYPLILSNNENLEVYLKVSYNKMEDEIQSIPMVTNKDTVLGVLGLDYRSDGIILSKYVQSIIDIYLSSGKLDFDNQEDKEADQNGANTSGRFSKINIDIKENLQLDKRWMWENSLYLQYSFGNKNLDGSEDLSIGGINGVKVYPQGEESAENGYVFSSGLLYTLPQFNDLTSQIGIFYDRGRVYMSDNFAGDTTRTLQDIGVNYNAFYKDFFLRSYLAYKVGGADVTSEDDYSSKFMFQLGYIF